MSRIQKETIPGYLRERAYKRDGYKCRYCGSTAQPLHIDHVYPESRGGAMVIGNLVTACAKCNNAKRAKIGIWPKPIGYFDREDRVEALKLEAAKMRAGSKKRLSFSSFILDVGYYELAFFPPAIFVYSNQSGNPINKPVLMFFLLFGMVCLLIGYTVRIIEKQGKVSNDQRSQDGFERTSNAHK